MQVQYLSRFDYNDGIKKIQLLFNAIQPYNQAQSDWLYKVIRLMNSDQWNALINSFPGIFDRMPTIKQVVDVARDQLVNIQAEIVQKAEDYYSKRSDLICKYCLHTGKIATWCKPDEASQKYVFGLNNESNYISNAGFCFRCPYCMFAEILHLGHDIPLWSDRFGVHFQVAYFDQGRPDTHRMLDLTKEKPQSFGPHTR